MTRDAEDVPMTEAPGVLRRLQQLRQEALDQLAEADLTCSRVRMQVERMESDLRVGLPEPAGFAEAKGTLLPRAEQAVQDNLRELWRLEERITLVRQRASGV